MTGATPRRLRVAVFNRVFATTGGGAESYSLRLVEELSQRHEVHVFAQQIDHQWPGVTYHRIACPFTKPRWINQLWYAWATWRATREGFDVVHSHENTWHGEVQTIHVNPVRHSLLSGRTGLRRVLRWVGIALSPRLLTYVWLEAARFRGGPRRQVVVTSNNLLADSIAAYPHASARMSVITPGVSWPGPGPDQAAARRSLGLPEAGSLVLFVANDYGRKGLRALLPALARLPDAVSLAVVGNAEGIPAFRDMAQGHGVAQRVFFLGPMKNVDLAYRAADLLAHPTLADTFAMVVLEAMAHGLPVVVSGAAYCGISALLEDGRNALLLEDPRESAPLADALARVISNPALAAQLSAQAREFAAAHSWSAAAHAYEALYFASLKPPA